MAESADPTPSRTAGDDRNLITIDENYLAPTFEDRVMMFWEKHGRTVIAVVIAVAVGLIGRWAFAQFAEAREHAVAKEFAVAKDPAALKQFIQAHPNAALAGAAYLRLADEAYSAGKYQDAQASYEAAVKPLTGLPLADRARLGAAISKLQAGDGAGAKTALEALANDLGFAKTLRAEAAFLLAVLARDARQPAEATKWTEIVLSAEPSGLWAQRALQLRSTLPAPAAATPAIVMPAAPATAPAPSSAVSFPGATK